MSRPRVDRTVTTEEPTGTQAPSTPSEVEIDLRQPVATESRLRTWLAKEFASPLVYLVPLRLFIGIGWTRAAIEKLIDPAWLQGDAMTSFIGTQVAIGAMPFEAYEWFSDHVWYSLATPLAWFVMLIELAIGLAIIFGVHTNAAFLFGIVLNVNFMLAGVINPSAFYIVIQIVLLAAGVGAVFGLDDRWRDDSSSFMVIARKRGLAGRQDRKWATVWAVAFAVMAGIAATGTQSIAPAEGVQDAALVLAVVMVVCSTTLLIAILRDVLTSSKASPIGDRLNRWSVGDPSSYLGDRS